jgi:regulator of sigma E protease
MFLIISNSIDSPAKRRSFSQLARRILNLVRRTESAAPFSLGIAMQVLDDQTVTIDRVLPGSAAERDGLQAGDALVSANGAAINGDPMTVLQPLLEEGKPIVFEVRRGEDSLRVTVQPDPR